METRTSQITGTFVADGEHSSLLFAVRHMKVSRFRASFRDVEARLSADAGALTLEGSARVDSISIDAPDFRSHVVDGADFFDGRAFPEIRFRSTRVDLADDGAVTVEGDLTIKGISRPVTATGALRGPVPDILGGRSASLELSASVDRREWGMDWQMALPDGDDVLGWTVELSAQLELHEEG